MKRPVRTQQRAAEAEIEVEQRLVEVGIGHLEDRSQYGLRKGRWPAAA
jgi:hypothetical protein